MKDIQNFLLKGLPLACAFFVSGEIYRNTQSLPWFWISVVIFIILLIYMIKGIFVDSLSAKGNQPSKRSGKLAQNQPQWLICFISFITSTVTFTFFAIILPLVIIILDISHPWLTFPSPIYWWLMEALGIIYLIYPLC